MYKLNCCPPQASPLEKNSKMILRKTDPSSFQEFLGDASRMALGKADAVVFPKTEKQVSEYLKISSQKKIPVTVAGNHTGLVGGAVPEGGEVLATVLMSQTFPKPSEEIIDIIEGEDEFTKIHYQFYIKKTSDGEIRAVAAPGLRLGEFQKRISEQGYFYPPDPTETNAFLGATVATNASGARTFKYGATRAHVKNLRTALSNGDILTIDREKLFLDSNQAFEIFLSNQQKISLHVPPLAMPQTKNAAGYFCKPGMNLIDLWIGSEGTLGVITEIELLLEAKPETVISGIAFFESDEAAIDYVEKIRQESYETWNKKDPQGIDMRALEYFDFHSLNLIRKNPLHVRVPTKAKAAIYFEQESVQKIDRSTLEQMIVPVFEKNSISQNDLQKLQNHPFGKMILFLKEKNALDDLELAFPNEEKAAERLKEFRHLLPVTVNEVIGKHKRESGFSHLSKVATDTAVPDQHFRPMMQFFKETLERSGIQYVIFGHIGNNHLHANLLPKNEKEFQEARNIYLELCRYAVTTGGTVSAEHGIGKLKHASLEILYGNDGVKKMAALKRALDPEMILGLGNIFPREMLQSKEV